MRNNNLLKVFSGQQNKRYKLKGKAESPLVFSGENLLEINDIEERTQNGITYSIKNGVVKIKGTATAQFDIILNNNLNLPKGTYALNTFADFRIIIRDGNSTWRINDVSGIATFNEYVGQCFIRIGVGSSIDITFYPMLVKGNVIPTHFVPYRKPLTYSYPLSLHSNNGERDFVSMLIKGYTEKIGNSILSANTPLKFTGENLIKIDDVSERTQKGITYSIINGIITVNGTSTTTFNLVSVIFRNLIGTYHFSGFSQDDNNSSRFYIYKNNTLIKSYAYSDGINYPTFDAQENDEIRLTIYILPNKTFNNYQFKPILVKGSTALPYEPYRETFYNPIEGFSLNGKDNDTDTFDTLTGIYVKKYDTRSYEIGDENNPDVVTNGITTVFKLATPQTYQKKPKTLPQWVKHVFDNSGRELDMTLTPITLAEPVADTYQNANGKITRKTNKIELSIQNSVAQEYTGYSYLLKFAQPLAKPNTPILCDLENTNIVQDNNYLIVEYHNPSFTTQEQYYNYFLYEKHELIYERATYDTETIRSVMINRQYTKCTDKNGVEVEMQKD